MAIAGIVVACGGSDAATDEGVPLPDRAFDASVADAIDEDSTLPGLPPADASSEDAASDAPVYIGCNGAVDCERVVFATTKEYGGGFGGVAEADQRCQTHADGSQSPRVKGRKFLAWISTAANPASARFPKGTKPYVRPDGAKVASDWTDLTKGTLAGGIGLNEDGAPPGGSNRAWTGTNDNGSAAGANCGNWKDTSLVGQRGNVGGNGAGWSDASNDACTNTGHLYCFEY